MLKKQKLTFKAETLRNLSNDEMKRAAGGLTMLQCQPTVGYTVCLCTTGDYNSCPCIATVQCEPSYRIC